MISPLLALSGLEPGVVWRLPKGSHKGALLIQGLGILMAAMAGCAGLAGGIWLLTGSVPVAIFVGLISLTLLLGSNYLTMVAGGADVHTPIRATEGASQSKKAPDPWKPYVLRRIYLLAICAFLSPWVVESANLLRDEPTLANSSAPHEDTTAEAFQPDPKSFIARRMAQDADLFTFFNLPNNSAALSQVAASTHHAALLDFAIAKSPQTTVDPLEPLQSQLAAGGFNIKYLLRSDQNRLVKLKAEEFIATVPDGSAVVLFYNGSAYLSDAGLVLGASPSKGSNSTGGLAFNEMVQWISSKRLIGVVFAFSLSGVSTKQVEKSLHSTALPPDTLVLIDARGSQRGGKPTETAFTQVFRSALSDMRLGVPADSHMRAMAQAPSMRTSLTIKGTLGSGISLVSGDSAQAQKSTQDEVASYLQTNWDSDRWCSVDHSEVASNPRMIIEKCLLARAKFHSDALKIVANCSQIANSGATGSDPSDCMGEALGYATQSAKERPSNHTTPLLTPADLALRFQQGPWWVQALVALALFMPFWWRDTSSALRAYEEARVEQALIRLRQRIASEHERMQHKLAHSLHSPWTSSTLDLVFEPFAELDPEWTPPSQELVYADIPHQDRQKWIVYLSPEATT